MGVSVDRKGKLLIRPYMSSLTYLNLKTRRCAVVNVTSDPRLFYLCAIKEANSEGKLPTKFFGEAKSVDAPRLREADAFIEVGVVEESSFSEGRAEFVCEVKNLEAKKTLPKVYCRAVSAVIEAVVHATRIKPFLFGTAEEKRQAENLIETVEVCRDIVARTAPDSSYSRVMDELVDRIALWRRQSEDLR